MIRAQQLLKTLFAKRSFEIVVASPNLGGDRTILSGIYKSKLWSLLEWLGASWRFHQDASYPPVRVHIIRTVQQCPTDIALDLEIFRVPNGRSTKMLKHSAL